MRSEARYDKVISHINETKEEYVKGLKNLALMYETLKEEVVNSRKTPSGNPNDDPSPPGGGGGASGSSPAGGEIRSRTGKLQKPLPRRREEGHRAMTGLVTKEMEMTTITRTGKKVKKKKKK